MILATVAYKLATEAERQEIETKIAEAAKYGKFKVDISRCYFEHIEDFIDTLKSNGYEVNFDGSYYYTISWGHAAPAFNQ